MTSAQLAKMTREELEDKFYVTPGYYTSRDLRETIMLTEREPASLARTVELECLRWTLANNKGPF